MSGLNRVLIGLIGLVTLVVGLVAVAAGTGLAPELGTRVGLGGLAASGDPLLPSWVSLSGSTTLVIIVVAALVLAVLAVLWLLSQLPARHDTRPLRLDARDLPGTAVVEPAALENAVQEQLLGRLGVSSVRVELRGAAAEPQLFVRLVAEEGADLIGIMAFVHTSVAADLSTALQVPLDRLGLTVDLGHPRRSDSVVRRDAGATPAAVAE